MKRLLFCLLSLFLAAGGWGATLPGFRVQRVASVASGFVSSIAIDSRGTIYLTTTNGSILRLDGTSPVSVAQVGTVAIGDSGLLGMALRDDRTAVVHYTTANQVADVISSIDLTTGNETIIHSFDADIEVPSRGSSAEHHGGNPIIAPDRSIFFCIGDYGVRVVASLPAWNGGKIWRVAPDGSAEQFALGVRNAFDLSWDAANQRLIAPDNGADVDDEINIVHAGDNLGWPFTAGNMPNIDGDVPPVYVFPQIVAPTGFLSLSGRNSVLQHGYLLGAFVTKAIYYIADIDHPAPIAVIRGETSSIIDVAQAPNGDLYFVTGTAVYRLFTPKRGDCNGDGFLDANDLPALLAELADGDGEPMTSAQDGAYGGSWGCDVNGDGLIDERDVAALQSLLNLHVRAVRH
jgi:glucose/arabinose dehydrogenase